MAKLRIRIKLNAGGEGAPLGQLVDVAKESERFLRMLASDLGMTIQRGEWLARRFTNSSVAFDSECPLDFPAPQVLSFNTAFAALAGIDKEDSRLPPGIRHRTLLQYAKIPDALGMHEQVDFGLYRGRDEEPFEWRPLSKRSALTLRARLGEEVSYLGSVHGRVHDVLVEASPQRSFRLRLGRTDRLVRCVLATDDLYESLREAIKAPPPMVYVQGQISARRIDREIERVVARRIRIAPKLSEDQYRSFFGASPEFTGTMSTEEFIDEARSYDR